MDIVDAGHLMTTTTTTTTTKLLLFTCVFTQGVSGIAMATYARY